MLPPSVRIYLAVEPADMRKGIDGLMAVVRNQFDLDAFSGHLFVFISRRRNGLKVLFWDAGGFVVYYKRLEAGRFKRPALEPGERTVSMTSIDLAMLLEGIDLSRVRKPKLWSPKKSAAQGSTSAAA